ncbi:MAG: hypothetical protein AAF443_07315 [Chlamydiota bacterium]
MQLNFSTLNLISFIKEAKQLRASLSPPLVKKMFTTNTHLQQLRALIFALLAISCRGLFAAAPVMHMWVAEQFCSICNITDDTERQALMVGNQFPDIRYISNVSRESTHPSMSKIEDVTTCSSDFFTVGMNLHSWTDRVREDAIDKEIYKDIAPYANERGATMLKFIEDEVLAELYDGTQWRHYFNTILPQELTFTDQTTVSKWHRIIQANLSIRPSWLLWLHSYYDAKLGLSPAELYLWSYHISEFAQQDRFKDHVRSLLDHLELELQQALTPTFTDAR